MTMTVTPPSGDSVEKIAIEDEMQRAYLDYAMSVIVSRALPDVRDGLKPVHRRILFGMDNLAGFRSRDRHSKSAGVVGDVMGKYHPHGDSSIYDALVRLAQPFANLHPMIDSQGNFGSRDGDKAAAMRYTECRLHKLADEVLGDIAKMPSEFWRSNYDEKRLEPVVLPSRVPNILVNGVTGIAVAMATNIPSHNLGETIDACLLVLDNPDVSLSDLMEVLPGPDLPVRCKILGRGGIRKAYETGNGSIRMAGEAVIEPMKGGRSQIVITALPYGVSARGLEEKIRDIRFPRDKNGRLMKMLPDWKSELDGVSECRDESDRTNDIRVVVELSRDADPNIVLNTIMRRTDFVKSFGYNATVLSSKGKPEVMSLHQILTEFVAFRRDVIRKRTIHDLDAARDSLHKEIGLYAATQTMDEVVRQIRASTDADDARARLMNMDFPTGGGFAQLVLEADPDVEVGEFFRLSELQAQTILEMRLRKLTGLERDEVAAKVRTISAEINVYLPILNDDAVLSSVVRREFEEVRAKHAKPRSTAIEEDMDDLDDEDLIEQKDVIITLTEAGYVKWTDVGAYREQRRGGKGRNGMETKEDDVVLKTLACHTKTPLVFFTSKGQAHALKAYKLPEGAPAARGRPIQNYVQLDTDEKVVAVIALPDTEEELDARSILLVTMFASRQVGRVRRNDAKAFWGMNRNGKIAIRLDDEVEGKDGVLVDVLLADDTDALLVSSALGKCVRFPIDNVTKVKSRTGVGVAAIKLGMGDRVISASVIKDHNVPVTTRDAYLAGGSATVKGDDGSETVHSLSAEGMAAMAADEEFVMTISSKGFGKRSSAYEYRTTSRGASGVAAANLSNATGQLVACFVASDDEGLVLMTDGGQTIRTRVRDVRKTGRNTRGVRMFNLPAGQSIVAVAKVAAEEIGDDEAVVIDGADEAQ